MSWLFLIVGIVCLFALQALRSGLAFVYPSVRRALVRRSPEDEDVAGRDLFDRAGKSLAAIGFDGPTWIETELEHGDDASVSMHAAFWHAGTKTIAWLAPPVDVATPNHPLTYFTTPLHDGRIAVTQVSDPFFATVEDAQTPAQTVAPAELSQIFEQHRDFVTKLGGAASLSGSATQQMLRFAGEHMNGIRTRLIERGRLVVSDGIARAGFRFAVRLLIKVLSRRTAQTSQRVATPPERVAHLARVVTASRNRAPARHVQWTLLAVSALLFVGIGWPVFGLQVTVVLLGVILFHEAGHWLAMRFAGYRNPHITLLPLLGGVTIGHEADPSAAKRAWVSLAGPLPGVVIGWALVFLLYTSGEAPDLSHWMVLTALLLLIINYLNVLPVPPLDGSHVVRALLPPRWIALHVVVVLLGVAAGLLLAWLLDFWALAFIAGLQLFAIGTIASDAQLLRGMHRDQANDLIAVCRHIDTLQQKKAPAAVRVAQALRLQQQLTMRPMGIGQGLVVAAVYSALAVVPIAAVVFATLVVGSGDVDVETALEEDERLYDTLRDEAAALSPADIAAELSLTLAPPATADQISAVEQRLGQSLPPHLRDWYRLSNGVPELDVGPVEEIRSLRSDGPAAGALAMFSYDGKLTFFSHDDFFTVALDDTAEWWTIGGGHEVDAFTFVDPGAAPGDYAVYQLVVDYAEAFTDMNDLLRKSWLDDRWNVVIESRMQERRERARQRLETLTIDELMDEFPRPSFVERLVTATWRLPDGASEGELAALEARIGQPLPRDHRRLLQRFDGYPPLFVLSSDAIQRADNVDSHQLDFLRESMATADGEPLVSEALAACWVVIGMVIDAGDEVGGGLYPQVLWCPAEAEARRYYNAMAAEFAVSLTAVLREVLAIRQSVAMD